MATSHTNTVDRKKLYPIELICDALPDQLTVLGVSYPVYTDFRRWLVVTQLFESGMPYRMMAECIAKAVFSPSVYNEIMKHGNEEGFYVSFFSSAGDFLWGKRQDNIETGIGTDRQYKSERYFDFASDAELIFASFYSTYGIDLAQCRMHWRKFTALLSCLPPDSPLMRVVEIRKTDTTKIADDEVRKAMRRAKALLRLR